MKQIQKVVTVAVFAVALVTFGAWLNEPKRKLEASVYELMTPEQKADYLKEIIDERTKFLLKGNKHEP